MIGATSFVAQAITKKMLQRGDCVYALGRSQRKLMQIESDFSAAGLTFADSYCYDFTDIQQTEDAFKLAKETLCSIDLVFICHGFLPEQQDCEHDIGLSQQVFDINLNSVIPFIQLAIQMFKKNGKGKLAVITSVAGDRGRPRNFTYGAAKGGLSIYLAGLRSSLWRSGIEVYTFKLGPVDSPMTVSHAKNFSFSSAENVADKMLADIEKRGGNYYVPGFWRAVMSIVICLPEILFQRLKFLSGR